MECDDILSGVLRRVFSDWSWLVCDPQSCLLPGWLWSHVGVRNILRYILHLVSLFPNWIFLVECSGQDKAVRPLGMFVFVCLFVYYKLWIECLFWSSFHNIKWSVFSCFEPFLNCTFIGLAGISVTVSTSLSRDLPFLRVPHYSVITLFEYFCWHSHFNT